MRPRTNFRSSTACGNQSRCIIRNGQGRSDVGPARHDLELGPNGDTIRVRSDVLVTGGQVAHEAMVVIDAKSLTTVGDAVNRPVISDTGTTRKPVVKIRNLGPGQAVVLRELALGG